MMRFCVLGGGSKGNAAYVEGGGTRLLIDAGFSGVEIERRLAAIGVDASTLDAILVTHEHHDHLRGVAVLSRRFGLPVFLNPATLKAAGKSLARLAAVEFFSTGTSFSLPGLSIHPFAVSHDAADPVGFLLAANGQRLGYCTDTGVASRLIRHRLAGCHGLVLECNHDPGLLRNGPYPPHLKQRVGSRNGHLANGEAAELLRELIHDGLHHVVLSHISQTNNHPEMVRQMVAALMEALRRERAAAVLPAISLAWQDRVGELVTLGRLEEDG